MTRYALVLAWLAATASPAGAVAASSSPNAIGVVAPDVIALTVRTGRVEPGRDVPYQRAEGDTVQTWDRQTWVARGGKPLGGPVGKGGTLVHTFDRVVGDRLDTARAAQPAAYAVASPDDPRFRTPQQPAAVYRKSKPSDLARTGPWEFDAAVTHVLYLRLAKPMKVGCRYRVTCPLPLAAAREFVFDPSRLRSEAVHVTHLGLRPDDPVKVAFLSCWMGTGGGLAYEAGTPFHVVDAATGTPAFHGKIVLRKAADDLTEDAYKRNYALTNVYEMDFSALRRPGTYRVVVDGVGCSWPVEVNHDVWRRAFLVSAKGFYHQRSGIALAPPYTRFRRPRCFHPDDGLKVYQSTCPLMDSGNGLNARGTDKNNFGNLVAGKTGTIVPNAWGGYFDAGDWDRRIQHLQATRLLLELAILHPGFGI